MSLKGGYVFHSEFAITVIVNSKPFAPRHLIPFPSLLAPSPQQPEYSTYRDDHEN